MSTQPNKDLWYYHGQAYDLKKFATVHPGGVSQLLNVQGRDCTEMVHSMHSLASLKKVEYILEKCKVTGSKMEDADSELFVWKEDGFYSTITSRVREYIKSLGKKDSHKADNKFWCIVVAEILVHIALMYLWIFKGYAICALLAGLVSVSLGFMVFHTAGHCAISKNPKVNNFWYTLYANFIMGFIDKVWDLHHNYGHHSYTNIHRKDPDVSNSLAVIRKNEHQTLKITHRYQWWSAYLLLIFFPNQWFGQVIQYFMSMERKKVFGMPILHDEQTEKKPFYIFFSIILALASLLTFTQGFLFAVGTLYLYSLGCGFLYWAAVFPNHETELSEHSTLMEVKDKDWGVHQVRHSSNFLMPQCFSYLIGGMNYQTEHHLFPSVHPRHYPVISKIVKEECEKINVKYNEHTSWFDALRGNFRQLKKMSTDKRLSSNIPKALDMLSL